MPAKGTVKKAQDGSVRRRGKFEDKGNKDDQDHNVWFVCWGAGVSAVSVSFLVFI